MTSAAVVCEPPTRYAHRLAVLSLLRLRSDRLHFGERPSGAAAHHLARRSELHLPAASRAGEERMAESGLDRRHLMGQGRLRVTEILRRPAERAQLGDGQYGS